MGGIFSKAEPPQPSPSKREPSVTRQKGRTLARTVLHVDKPKQSALIVAALDFGTAFSGYAYSFRDKQSDLKTNYWNGKIKTPTAVLINSSGMLDTFGDDARAKYEKLIEKGEHKKWYFFDKFKMKLFAKGTTLDKSLELEDFMGKKLKAFYVFTAAIQYLKEHLIRVLNERQENVKIKPEKDIHWVLTVPAIWNDLSKVFMRQAAEQAGIPGEMLTLALEPEAASLYCEDKFGKSVIPVGCQYMILDLGGGTADIACHENTVNGLKEIAIPTGGDFGGLLIDNKFISILNRLFGGEILREFKHKHTADYWEILKDFEDKKRKFNGSSSVNIYIPPTLHTIFRENIGQPIQETLLQSTLLGQVEFRQDKMILSIELVTYMFKEVVEKTKKCVATVMNDIPVEYIVMVGGLSESPYVKNEMSNEFGNKIKIPDEPAGAIVFGAVLFGHNPKGIVSRKCRYTYGIPRLMKFKPHHPQNKKVTIGGVDYCDDLFNKHIEVGQEVSLDGAERAKSQTYFPSTTEMKQAIVEVYASTKRNPVFIDEEDSVFVGLIKVDIDPEGDIYSKIHVKLVFGGTELVVDVEEEKGGNKTIGSVDFLG